MSMSTPCYSTAEYCAAVWERSPHASKVDVELNRACRSITGNLMATPLSALHTLASICPPGIRRDVQTRTEREKQLSDPRHPLYGHQEVPRRLKSRRSFMTARGLGGMTPATLRVELWRESHPSNNRALPPPSETLPPGTDLRRRDWVALNRARAKVARTGDNLARWGKSTSTTCSCGEDPQTIQHLMHDCRLGPTCTDTDLQEANEAARNWLETKRLIVDVIRVQPGDNLTDILTTPTTLDQEDEHQRLVKKREAQDEKSQKKGGLSRSQSAHGDNKLPVEAMKRKVLRHLRALEGVGLVSSTDNYQVMINDIAKDIRNQRRYRIRRRQELLKLKETTKALESKSQFYEEQIDYYNQYIKTCLDNLAKKKRRSKFLQGGKEEKPKKAKPPLKYTGARLHEKGVILEIDGLPPNQFKNVLFEIQETEDAGKFEVSAKFMGVAMEKVDLNLQDLLQLQYEGVSVMNMFDKAKVNVNLLIFLLNRKFYGK
ncbi:IQ motif-containing GTPase-activating protein 3 [Branchiostoma belcheri]|nr:IQ motif-containing GTPase-activating protein 3 [Branchiostoma belcheri]